MKIIKYGTIGNLRYFLYPEHDPDLLQNLILWSGVKCIKRIISFEVIANKDKL